MDVFLVDAIAVSGKTRKITFFYNNGKESLVEYEEDYDDLIDSLLSLNLKNVFIKVKDDKISLEDVNYHDAGASLLKLIISFIIIIVQVFTFFTPWCGINRWKTGSVIIENKHSYYLNVQSRRHHESTYCYIDLENLSTGYYRAFSRRFYVHPYVVYVYSKLNNIMSSIYPSKYKKMSIDISNPAFNVNYLDVLNIINEYETDEIALKLVKKFVYFNDEQFDMIKRKLCISN